MVTRAVKKFSHDQAAHEIHQVLGENKTMKSTVDLAIKRVAANTDSGEVTISTSELNRREANKEASDTLQEIDNNVRVLAQPLIQQAPAVTRTMSGPGGSRTTPTTEEDDTK